MSTDDVKRANDEEEDRVGAYSEWWFARRNKKVRREILREPFLNAPPDEQRKARDDYNEFIKGNSTMETYKPSPETIQREIAKLKACKLAEKQAGPELSGEDGARARPFNSGSYGWRTTPCQVCLDETGKKYFAFKDNACVRCRALGRSSNVERNNDDD